MTAAVVPIRRGRELTPDGRVVLRLYPLGYGKRSRAGTWIYAVGYRDGRTKLGITAHPRARLLQHWIACDGAVEWVHLFGCVSDSRTAAAMERRALALAAKLAQRIRFTETFFGLPRAGAIRCVREAIAEQG